jgi:flagellar motor protein MotB
MSELVKKPRRKFRVESENHEAVHDDGHSWAVSYADFLMVLLSFFIIFFSTDEAKKESIIEKIAKATGELKAGENSAQKTEAPVVIPQSANLLPQGVKEVADSVGGVFVEGTKKGNKLFIYLDDNSYAPGKIDLPAEKQAKLSEILEKLRPFMPDITLTFEGHTDDVAFKGSKSKYLVDNFDLSSLRATKAVQYAVRLGYDPNQLLARGVAEYSRGTRTLSVVVAAREVEE